MEGVSFINRRVGYTQNDIWSYLGVYMANSLRRRYKMWGVWAPTNPGVMGELLETSEDEDSEDQHQRPVDDQPAGDAQQPEEVPVDGEDEAAVQQPVPDAQQPVPDAQQSVPDAQSARVIRPSARAAVQAGPPRAQKRRRVGGGFSKVSHRARQMAGHQ